MKNILKFAISICAVIFIYQQPAFSQSFNSSIHLTFGNPSGAVTDVNVPDNYLLLRNEYAMSYNDTNRIPNWVAWQLNDSWLGDAERQDNFRADNDLPTSFFHVDANDYLRSGFDRGHLCPSADRTVTVTDNENTFFMTNMIPQAPKNNRDVWGDFEDYLRTLTNSKDLYIYAGGYGQGGDGAKGFVITIGEGIVVPSNTWKTVLVVDRGETPADVSADDFAISIDIPNSQSVSGTSWQNWVVSVDEIETSTGHDFFSELPDDIESTLEASRSFSSSFSGVKSSNLTAFVNEFHYDNSGKDVQEGVEIAGVAGTNLDGWSLQFYNGGDGRVYKNVALTGILPDQDDGFGTLFFGVSGIQNGKSDSVALVDNSVEVVQFLSFEGALTAVGGAANGLTSTDIGVSETGSTSVGSSLQLVGTGSDKTDFTWVRAESNSYGSVNVGQEF